MYGFDKTLPAKVGDTVYRVDRKHIRVVPMKVHSYHLFGSRRDVVELVESGSDKDKILSLAVIINKPHLLSKEDTLYVLDTLPAVDAEKVCEQMGLVKEAFEMAKADLVAVCRCKDCKWLYNGLGMYCCTKHTGLALIIPDGSGFCSYGERRADRE